MKRYKYILKEEEISKDVIKKIITAYENMQVIFIEGDDSEYFYIPKNYFTEPKYYTNQFNNVKNVWIFPKGVSASWQNVHKLIENPKFMNDKVEHYKF